MILVLMTFKWNPNFISNTSNMEKIGTVHRCINRVSTADAVYAVAHSSMGYCQLPGIHQPAQLISDFQRCRFNRGNGHH